MERDGIHPYSRRDFTVSVYPISFCSAAWKTLDALGLDPRWSLSGRAALLWLTTQTGPIKHLSLVWHRRDGLGRLSGDVLALLANANLDVGFLYSDSRRLWLPVKDGESACTLRLTAEPAPPLAPALQFPLHGHFINIESWRDILQMTLCSLGTELNPDDLVDLFLLLGRRETSLDQGLLDALRRDPSFDPQRLALSLAQINLEEADMPLGVSLEEFGRFLQNLAIRLLAWARPH